MGSAETEGCAGVALFGKSLEADLAAFVWAYKHLPLSKKYKLRIIHVNELNNGNLPRERPDSQYGCRDLETKFMENYPDCNMGTHQSYILLHKIEEYICGVTYEGENFEATLQHAINSLQKEGLDTLVLGWSAADDTKGTPPINKLESNGCSIVLAKVDSRKLTFSMPPTQGSAATATAPPMASALTNQYDKTNSSTSSKAKTRCPNRETDTDTLPALPMAPTEGSNSKRTTEAVPSKAQSTSAGSETDTRRPGGRREKDTAHNEPAQPSSREKTEII